MTELSEEALILQLEEATRAGMLHESGESWRFAHPLIQETLYKRLSALRRRRLHLRAAEAIEADYGDNLDPPLATLATHYRR